MIDEIAHQCKAISLNDTNKIGLLIVFELGIWFYPNRVIVEISSDFMSESHIILEPVVN